ncbi:hypothetical protein G9A89_012306 [Geosiphon pyriformis]|nr:hypothetical protein G9A89_012306 [Geosiphon pyriformis]
MTMTRAKSKKAAPDICPKISNKISTKKALSVVKATRQNVLKAFPLPSNHEKLFLITTEATSLSLTDFSLVKVFSKRHTWVSLSVTSTPTKSPKEQLPASAIITLNPFVVPNEILDEISIASSGMSSKMGQDQPLAVLPNMVSSSKSLLILEAKQSLPVGSPVLVNWTDQMETELSPFLAVFQSVYGFLGAKSVLKDNIKLFCVEFASQISLDAVFLVKLTSSVCLVILKIAKSLVVSESGSLSAAVVLCNVPLGVSAADIKTALSVFGMVTHVVLKPIGIWQYVVVHFKKLDSAMSALNHWSVLVDKNCVRILLLAPKIFKPHFVGSLSYAKAFASSVMSEFPFLVAFTPPVAVIDSAIGSRLNSLKKQISDLAALVKSIVEPSEKDLLSMKYASNNFANLLVGVSKNIACLRSEVDFGDMDYDDIQAAKLFLLSEDTFKHVIALCVDMEKECLVKETSFDYGKGGTFTGRDSDHTPKSSKTQTKRALDKPLRKINFLNDDDNNIFLDKPVVLPPLLKNLVNISVHKSFALDIGLDKVIIRMTFTSELGLIKATNKTASAKIMVNTNLKKFTERSDQTVVIKEIPIGTLAETVRTVLFEFGNIKMIKMQLIRLWQKAVIKFEQLDHANLVTAKWSILIRKNAICVAIVDLDKKTWDVRDQHKALAVGGKTCVIDCYPVIYAQTRCAVICFDSAELLNAVMRTTLVLRSTNLHWLCLVLAGCTKYEKLGHMLLGCATGRKIFFGVLLCKVLLDADKSRLAAIYAKCLVPVAYPVFFGAKVGSSSEMKPSLLVIMDVNDRFVTLECSFANLAEQVGKLAKRLDTLGPMVSQPSLRCQPLITPLLQDQGADVVMSKSSGASTGGKTVMEVVLFDMSLVSKLEDSIKCLMETVLSFSAKIDSLSADLVSQLPFQ